MLLVEDDDGDAALVLHTLRRSGYEVAHERVQTQGALKAALEANDWDVIISDHALPSYSGLVALADAQASGKDIPFILVSGTLGESAAVDAMRAGACDYVMKDQLARLPAAVEREVREAAARSDQKRMREQLMISDRMASAGTLAAGVAHEINNPLAAAAANLEFVASVLLRIREEAGTVAARGGAWTDWLDQLVKEMWDPLTDTREAVTRIRDIVRDVKLFSRPHAEQSEAIDVRRVIESTIRMCWNEIRHRARIIRDFGTVHMVKANESRLGQVLLNLLVNAAQAMPEGHAKNNEIRIVTRTERDRVIIQIRDTGVGIPRESLERIFDPFFTTKPAGVGTGLGLAICHRIVRDLGGDISVESELGKGSVFSVALPVVRSQGRARSSFVAQSPAVARARVLVVDDEAAIRRALQRVLARHHDVTALASGNEALSRIVSGDRFDAILSDLMMPDVTGMEMYDQLSKIAPDQAKRMIFFSGGAFTSRARAFLDTVSNPRLDKPFELTNVLEAIAGIMK